MCVQLAAQRPDIPQFPGAACWSAARLLVAYVVLMIPAVRSMVAATYVEDIDVSRV
jgi:hypothetical protein